MEFSNQDWNNSASCVLAAAIIKLYPDTKIIQNFANEEEFYCDFKFVTPLSQNDLPKIQKQMKKICGGAYPIKNQINTAQLNQYQKNTLIKKPQLVAWSLGELVTGYSNIANQITNTNLLKSYQLLDLSGAYLNNDKNDIQVTRIYGFARQDALALKAYKDELQDRKERDHRYIGKQLEIFTFSPLSGKGFPIWLPNGFVIRQEIEKFIKQKEAEYDFTQVLTPALGSVELYKTSGHWNHYKDDNYPLIELDKEQLMLRPMTCPHHCIIYKMKGRSYKELPMRLAEHAKLYRYEKSGALTGLERVRAMVLTDAHIFAREDQIVTEFKRAYKLIDESLAAFNIEIDYISLSLRDPADKEKFYDDDQMWDKAEKMLLNLLENDIKVKFKTMIGEAAFYGPKLDIQIKTAIGREITVSTLQLDFLLPKKFDLEYIDADGKKAQPVIIHRGLIGTYERFVATLLEQTKGVLPLWLAPNQVLIIPISQNIKHLEYAKAVKKSLLQIGLRAKIDDRVERLSYKMRQAQQNKVPVQFIIGDSEVANETISYRKYAKNETHVASLNDVINLMKSAIDKKCQF